MLVKVFTLRFDPRLEGFDDRPLLELCRAVEVLSVRDHFFVRDETPYWGVMVSYNLPPRDGEPGARAGQRGDEQRPKTDYRTLLREEDWPLFNALRDWRSGVARAEGVPPYIVVPNEVLASIARERPTSLNALGQLRGMGEARLKRHGRALLEALGVAAAPRQGEGVAAEPATAGGERGSDAATEDAVDASS